MEQNRNTRILEHWVTGEMNRRGWNTAIVGTQELATETLEMKRDISWGRVKRVAATQVPMDRPVDTDLWTSPFP